MIDSEAETLRRKKRGEKDLEGHEGEELGEELLVHVLVHLVEEEPVPDGAVPQLSLIHI